MAECCSAPEAAGRKPRSAPGWAPRTEGSSCRRPEGPRPEYPPPETGQWIGGLRRPERVSYACIWIVRSSFFGFFSRKITSVCTEKLTANRVISVISLASGAGRPRAVNAGGQNPGGQQDILGQVLGGPSAPVKDQVFVERVVETGADQPGGDVAAHKSLGQGAGAPCKQQKQQVVQQKAGQRAGCEFQPCFTVGQCLFHKNPSFCSQYTGLP